MDTWDQMPLGLQLMARQAWDAGTVKITGIQAWLARFGHRLTVADIHANVTRA